MKSETIKGHERVELLKIILKKNISDSSDEKISLIIKNCEKSKREQKAKELCEILEKYDEEEAMLYIELLEKYKYDPKLLRQVKWSIEQGKKPEGLAKTLEMF